MQAVLPCDGITRRDDHVACQLLPPDGRSGGGCREAAIPVRSGPPRVACCRGTTASREVAEGPERRPPVAGPAASPSKASPSKDADPPAIVVACGRVGFAGDGRQASLRARTDRTALVRAEPRDGSVGWRQAARQDQRRDGAPGRGGRREHQPIRAGPVSDPRPRGRGPSRPAAGLPRLRLRHDARSLVRMGANWWVRHDGDTVHIDGVVRFDGPAVSRQSRFPRHRALCRSRTTRAR